MKRVFPTANLKLKAALITRWGEDEFSLGSYSALHVGSKPEHCKILSSPIGKQVWLIGEHCNFEQLGTVYGAYLSGHQSANEVINQLCDLTKN